MTILEPARSLSVIYDADVCVLGGSCTGLFAAVRAARMGARVVIVEKDNCFGGVATTAMVNAWHSLWDTEGKRQIIAGLTEEVVDRLDRRGALKRFGKVNPSYGFTFNSEELKIELDDLAEEAGIKVYFHSMFAAPVLRDSRLEAVAVENKSGRGAIRARMFVDATGDADLVERLSLPTFFANHLQPATTCARFSGWDSITSDGDYGQFLREYGNEFGLPPGFAWGCGVPGASTYMLAATRIHGINPANADDLTRGEMEGRRQIRAIQSILRKAVPNHTAALEALPSRLGLRESRHIRGRLQLTGDDILFGRKFDDAIGQGSYRVDIHHQNEEGITLRYLDGREEYCRPGLPRVESRWRGESSENPTFYQIPYRALLPANGCDNVIVAGRALDVDNIAHAAVRVMVNCNQMGEAAGVAAVLGLQADVGFPAVPVETLKRTLAAGGSAPLVP